MLEHSSHARVPDVVGGGTVSYVSPVDHDYLDDLVARAEGGTPAILESIRCGLVFALKSAVGIDTIKAREESFVRRAFEVWGREESIQILGNTQVRSMQHRTECARTSAGEWERSELPVGLLS